MYTSRDTGFVAAGNYVALSVSSYTYMLLIITCPGKFYITILYLSRVRAINTVKKLGLGLDAQNF